MGVAYYVSIEKAPDDFDASMDGKFLGRAIGKLNKEAVAAGLKPFNELFSQNPENLLDLLTDGDRRIMEQTGGLTGFPPEQWFAPTEGLKTVRHLIGWAASNPAELKKAAEVVTDLKRLEGILVEADRRGLRFHFSIDI